jgi:hypothetical protein
LVMLKAEERADGVISYPRLKCTLPVERFHLAFYNRYTLNKNE